MIQTVPTADDVNYYANQLHIDLANPSASSIIAKHYLTLTGRYRAPRREKESVTTAIRSLIAQLLANHPKPL